MMGFITGLKDIGNMVDEANKPKQSKFNWLKVEDGQSVKIRFVNELDESSPSYDSTRGLAFVVEEHSNPGDFRRKAVCTMDTEGRCVGCEMNERGKEGWYAKMRFYINVLVDDGVKEPYLAVWHMGVRRNAVFETIREYAVETGSVSNLTWRLKRTGTGTDTTWTLLPTSPDAVPFDWSKYDAPSLESVPRTVPYSEQEEYYLAVKSAPEVDTNAPW
jgi:hypothetical protein